LIEIGLLIQKKKIFKNFQCVSTFLHYLPLEESHWPSFEDIWIPSSKDDQWIWRISWNSQSLLTDGQWTISKTHLSFKFRWAKSFEMSKDSRYQRYDTLGISVWDFIITSTDSWYLRSWCLDIKVRQAFQRKLSELLTFAHITENNRCYYNYQWIARTMTRIICYYFDEVIHQYIFIFVEMARWGIFWRTGNFPVVCE
jgi:hypothetical protein